MLQGAGEHKRFPCKTMIYDLLHGVKADACLAQKLDLVLRLRRIKPIANKRRSRRSDVRNGHQLQLRSIH